MVDIAYGIKFIFDDESNLGFSDGFFDVLNDENPWVHF